jgi:hypothetical protein
MQMHWKAIRLPDLQRPVDGFRDNETGRWRGDRQVRLADDKRLVWVTAENWFVDQISRRSHVAGLSLYRVLLIGAGAIGSMFGELIVRGGVSDITVMDGQNLEIGNLVRHTLTMEDVKTKKALGLVNHFRALKPEVVTKAYATRFPPSGEMRVESLFDRNLVVDCTGDDDVLDAIGSTSWPSDTKFLSLSAGLGATRLYVYLSAGRLEPEHFRELVEPYLDRDRQEFSGELPWDATGCWHPLFPARLDELWSLVATAIPHIESLLRDLSSGGAQLLVIERTADGGMSIR